MIWFRGLPLIKVKGLSGIARIPRFKFLMVMVGMTLTLGGLAFAAFWIGGHLNFGLATDTQARVNDHRSLPNALDLSEDTVFVDSIVGNSCCRCPGAHPASTKPYDSGPIMNSIRHRQVWAPTVPQFHRHVLMRLEHPHFWRLNRQHLQRRK